MTEPRSDSVSHCLTESILGFIAAGVDADLDCFNDYALMLFALHYENNTLFREFCDAKNVRPEDIERWEDVPVVYSDVFKTHLVASFPLEKAVMACLTGGTTSLTQRGRIFRDEDGRRLVFAANRMMTGAYLFPDFAEGERCRILILAPSPELAPSMGMATGMEQTRRAFGTDDSMFVLGKTGIDIKTLIKALRESEASGVPVALIGATSAYVYFFQACRRRKMSFSLPHGSRVCDGGGYRGRFGPVSRDDYYGMVGDTLGVPDSHCVNVLGEAETATNLFDDSLRRHIKSLAKRERTRPVPPWSRVRAMHIDTLKPLPDGEVGLLAHWDLECSVQGNLKRIQHENIFGKASRSRVEDILRIFRQRYLTDESVTRALVILVKNRFPASSLDRILYFHSAQSDRLLFDVVVNFLVDLSYAAVDPRIRLEGQ